MIQIMISKLVSQLILGLFQRGVYVYMIPIKTMYDFIKMTKDWLKSLNNMSYFLTSINVFFFIII